MLRSNEDENEMKKITKFDDLVVKQMKMLEKEEDAKKESARSKDAMKVLPKIWSSTFSHSWIHKKMISIFFFF
jgi:hypothetical protein